MLFSRLHTGIGNIGKFNFTKINGCKMTEKGLNNWSVRKDSPHADTGVLPLSGVIRRQFSNKY